MTESVTSLAVVLAEQNCIKRRGRMYINLPCSFDIETTSFMQKGMKRATMYVWCLNINGTKIIGRNWYEYFDTLKLITKYIEDKTLVIYIHNLAYEFQFMRHWMQIKNVFASTKRKPIYVQTSKPNIEYRCSYMLTGLSLEKWGEKLKCSKLSGTVDYSLPRHSETKLTDDDFEYVARDTEVVVVGIRQEIELNGDITKIPITKTGYVRRTCREACIKNDDEYRVLMSRMKLTANEYDLINCALMGGHTHANASYIGDICTNVVSKDETSAYPYVMVTEKFPLSKGTYMNSPTYDEVKGLIKRGRCCVFAVKFKNIMVKVDYESIISKHKCRIVGEEIINNGRVWFAEELSTTITEIDLENIEKFYTWDDIEFGDLYWYFKKRLPRSFVMSILQLYKDKTELKDVEGQEVYYMKSKEQVNSAYGMCVTDVVRDKIGYDNDEWYSESPDIEDVIRAYNNNSSRFLAYIWGLYVTAYSRRNLYMAIHELKEDYRYSDTDCVKYVNPSKHEKWFEEYNKKVIEKLKESSIKQNIPYEYFVPKTIEGIEKPLGVWETDGIYDKFKTLGAKRYAYEKNGDFHITVAGLGKKKGAEYIKEMGGFDFFKDNMIIPPNHTGKLTHTYIDEPFRCLLTDLNGEIMEVRERSCIHLGECGFDMSLSNKFKLFLIDVIRKEI